MESPLDGPRFYEAPDLGKGGTPTSTPEPEENHEKENAAEALKYSRRESLSDEFINSAETPEELFIGLRQLEKQLEDAHIPPNLSERYTPPRQLSAMFERADMLHFTIDDLEKRGWITNYNPDTGEAKIKNNDRRFAALAIKVEQTDNYEGRFYKPDIRYYFGKGKKEDGINVSKERLDLEKAYRDAIRELEVRDVIGEHVSLRLNLDYRDSLEALTQMLHSGRMPNFKADHLRALFNMPGTEELKTDLNNHMLGDQVEEAIFCNLIMLNSWSKQKMQDLLVRPGTNELIRRMIKRETKKENVTQVTDKELEDWKVKYIGHVNEWKDDNGQTHDGWVEDTARTTKTYMVEDRGLLTKWSNIASYEGPDLQFSTENERKFIEDYVGTAVGNKDASWIAATLMRAIGTYASEGYVALPPGEDKDGKDISQKEKFSLKLGEGRFISSDDTGKFYAFLFNLKEGLKGRSSGLKDMIGRIPDMAMNLFDWAQVEVPDTLNEDGKPERRSIWDAWLGTPAGKAKIDLLTGKMETDLTNPDNVTKFEGYHRLGDLKFETLERDFHGTYTIMQWLMGNERGPVGVFIDALKTDFKMEEDFTLNALKKKIKYIGIVMNPNVLTKGSKQLYKYEIDPTTGKKSDTYTAEIIQRIFFKNLMAARIRSSSFVTDIMPQPTKIFNTGAVGDTFLDVPATNLINIYISEVLQPLPQDEEALIGHYIDDLTKLQKLTSWKDAGKVRENTKAWLTDTVGIVTGHGKI